MADLIQEIAASPIIAAVRDAKSLARALETPVRAVFLLGGDLLDLPEWVDTIRTADKLPFVHIDLVDGVSRDAAGVRVISRMVRPAGILSTRAPLLRVAAEEGLLTVLRMFLVDSSSLESGVRMEHVASPNLVEIMPGLVARAIAHLGQHIRAPIIAGGMVMTRGDVQSALSNGALGVSTSHEPLWRDAAQNA